MKKLAGIIFLLCLMNYVFGQGNNVDKNDSTKSPKSFVIKDATEITNDDAIFIIDNKPAIKTTSKHILKEVDPNDILEIEVLKDSAFDRTSSAGFYGRVVRIITRVYAISQYQKKLSALSDDYKKEVYYQMKYNNGDQSIMYIVTINGVLTFFTKDKLIQKLYDTPIAYIKAVELQKKQTCCGINTTAIITIQQ